MSLGHAICSAWMQTGSSQSLLSSLVLTSSISKSGQHPRWKNNKQCSAFIKSICPVALTLCSMCFRNKETKVLQWLQPEVCHSLVHEWTIFAWSGSHGFQDTQGVLQPGTTAKASYPANSLHAIMPGWKKSSFKCWLQVIYHPILSVSIVNIKARQITKVDKNEEIFIKDHTDKYKTSKNSQHIFHHRYLFILKCLT